MKMILVIAVAATAFLSAASHSLPAPVQPAMCLPALPDKATTPGWINEAVTQDNIGATICDGAWLARFDIVDPIIGAYVVDHLIPVSLGGAPADPRNLWLQSREDAARKDLLEAVFRVKVCSGQMSLRAVQEALTTDWVAAYAKYMRCRRCQQS